MFKTVWLQCKDMYFQTPLWKLIDRRTYEKKPSTGVLYYACQNPMKARQNLKKVK